MPETGRRFDEAEVRDLVRRDVERANDFAAVQNHDLLEEDDRHRTPPSTIAAPTLVIHGTADPMFPLAHGQALVREIPSARLLPLERGRPQPGVQHTDWDAITQAIATHTASGPASTNVSRVQPGVRTHVEASEPIGGGSATHALPKARISSGTTLNTKAAPGS